MSRATNGWKFRPPPPHQSPRRSSRCLSPAWQCTHRHCRFARSQNRSASPRWGRTWSATKSGERPTHPHRAQAKPAASITSQRSRCHAAVLYQRRHTSTRLRGCEPDALAARSRSPPTRGASSFSLPITMSRCRRISARNESRPHRVSPAGAIPDNTDSCLTDGPKASTPFLVRISGHAVQCRAQRRSGRFSGGTLG